MTWKQFLTPVASLSALEAKEFITQHSPDSFTLLDVRQPKEYEQGHLPGARLLPLPGLTETLNQLDPQKPTIVYCAVGGRSRIAAQMLSGKGFREVYNLSGGMKAWQSETAFGATEQGLHYFTGKEKTDEILIVAFGLETGLRDYYLEQASTIAFPEAASLFRKMADIEVRHQEKIVAEYNRLTNESLTVDTFEKQHAFRAMEGGMSTEEYAQMVARPPENAAEVIYLAMSIEAQALDLYLRAAEISRDRPGKEILEKIASEERAHLNSLAHLLDTINV